MDSGHNHERISAMTHPISAMLRLFRDGVESYQPTMDGLEPETGDPRASRDNIQRLIDDGGLVLADFLVRSTGILVMFANGEQYYAPGLRVGTKGLATQALAHFAAEADFGPEQQLLEIYQDQDVPDNETVQLVNLNLTPLTHPRP